MQEFIQHEQYKEQGTKVIFLQLELRYVTNFFFSINIILSEILIKKDDFNLRHLII